MREAEGDVAGTRSGTMTLYAEYLRSLSACRHMMILLFANQTRPQTCVRAGEDDGIFLFFLSGELLA